MTWRYWIGMAFALGIGCAPVAEVRAASWGTQLTGVCDVSAAVWIDEQLWVANDEDNALRVYGADGKLIRVAEPSLDQLVASAGFNLNTSKDGVREMDLEAVATIPRPEDEVVFWLGSHGNRKAKISKGKVRDADARPNRQVLLATLLSKEGKVSLVGKPITGLGGAWLSAQFPADVTAALAVAKPRHANAGGWNLEGLATDLSNPEQPALWLGFRSPVDKRGRALVVRFDNPMEATMGATPALSHASWIDLGGRGIRAMDADPQGGWRIVAGPVDQVMTEDLALPQRAGLSRDFALYHWDGPGTSARRVEAINDLRPEAVVVLPGGMLLISDDGKVLIGDEPCGDLPAEQQKARMRWMPNPR